MSSSARRTGRRVMQHQGYLLPEESERLVQYCAALHVSESAVIREALARYVRDTVDDVTLLMQRADRGLRAQARTQRDLELLSEGFGLFVKFWFAHRPAVSTEDRPAARATAGARHTQFVDDLAQQFSAGRRFLDDLPRESLADDEELAIVARRASASSGSSDA